MHLLTPLLLVLVSCITALGDHQLDDTNIDADTNIFARNIYSNGLRRYLTYIETPQTKECLQQRSFSQFRQAWKTILKPAFDFQRRGLAGTNGKVFAKVGGPSDALRDFKSLRPTGVNLYSKGGTGFVENQDIILNTKPNDLRSSVLYVLDFNKGAKANKKAKTRAIFYFNNKADSEAYFHNS